MGEGWKEESGQGRSTAPRLIVDEKRGGGSAPSPPGYLETTWPQSDAPTRSLIRGSSTAATTRSRSGSLCRRITSITVGVGIGVRVRV